MAKFSDILILTNHRPHLALVMAFLMGLILTFEAGQGLLRQLQSAGSTPEITVVSQADGEYRFDIKNYVEILNSGDTAREISLSPAYDTWASYGADKEGFNVYFVTNFTGFTKMTARFPDGCLFPVLGSSVNSLDFPSLLVDSSVPYFKLNNTVLGFPRDEISQPGVYRVIKNFNSLSANEIADIREQVIDFSSFIDKIEFGAIIYCAYSAPGVKKFEVEIKVQKKQSLYELDISDKFQSSGKHNLTFSVVYDSELHLLANSVRSNATLSFNISSPESVLVKVEYQTLNGKKSPSGIDNVFFIEPCDNLDITIVNMNPNFGETVLMDLNYIQGSSTNLSAGQIAGIVLGCVGALIVASILIVFRKRIFSCCSKNTDYNKQYSDQFQKKNKIPSEVTKETSRYSNNPITVMTSNTLGTYPEFNDAKKLIMNNEMNDLINKDPTTQGISTQPNTGPQYLTDHVVLPMEFPELITEQENQKVNDGPINPNINQIPNVQSAPEVDIPIMRVKIQTDISHDQKDQPLDRTPDKSELFRGTPQAFNENIRNVAKRNAES